MIATGAEYGLTPNQVWDMTPREFRAFCKGRRTTIRRESKWSHADAVTAGWWSGVLSQSDPKKIPKLKQLLESILKDEPERQQEQEPETMLRIVEMWNQALGGEDLRTNKNGGGGGSPTG